MITPPYETVQYRLERAEEAYHDALTLSESGGWNSCVNRLYYSCFYAVSALLLQDNLSSPKHTGVRGIFNKDYVRTGIISKDQARLYNDLFERRQEADYGDFVYFEESEISPLLPQVRDLLDSITKILAQN